MEKYKRGNLFGLGRHIHRLNERYGNENVDIARVCDDYDLVPSKLPLYKRVKQRIAELDLKRKPRSDAVLLCSHIVSLSREDVERLGKAGVDAYFADSYAFYCDRRGAENIVTATVHWDETNPHMHLGEVPVTEDGRLCAKDLYSRVEDPQSHEIIKNDLEDLQEDFFQSVGILYGLQRGIPSTRKHLDERAYKQAMDKERQKEIATNEAIINIVSQEEPEYFNELVDRVFSKPKEQTQGGEDRGR